MMIAIAYDTSRMILSIQILFLVVCTHIIIAPTSHTAPYDNVKYVWLSPYDDLNYVLSYFSYDAPLANTRFGIPHAYDNCNYAWYFPPSLILFVLCINCIILRSARVRRHAPPCMGPPRLPSSSAHHVPPTRAMSSIRRTQLPRITRTCELPDTTTLLPNVRALGDNISITSAFPRVMHLSCIN